MKNFIITVIYGFILNTIIIIYYHGVSIDTLKKSLQVFILLNISSAFGFLNFFNLKNSSNIISAICWLLLVLFAIYIYESSNKYSLYLWLIFMTLWLIFGVYNPNFKA